jgi:5'-nucleotidase
MHLLLTNDDGFDAPGLGRLVEALTGLGELSVVAPDRERSAVSHSITLRDPIRAQPVPGPPGVSASWRVDGTPADCVRIALAGLLGSVPDLVLSGVNRGINVGVDVLYSGTVAGAREALIHGVGSLAVSAEGPDYDFDLAARVAADFARMHPQHPLPEGVMLNINVPCGLAPGEAKMRLVRQEGNLFEEKARVETGPDGGERIFRFNGEKRAGRLGEGTDCGAVQAGWISVSALGLSLNRTPADRRVVEMVRSHPLNAGGPGCP